jgi:hypothetical protein
LCDVLVSVDAVATRETSVVPPLNNTDDVVAVSDVDTRDTSIAVAAAATTTLLPPVARTVDPVHSNDVEDTVESPFTFAVTPVIVVSVAAVYVQNVAAPPKWRFATDAVRELPPRTESPRLLLVDVTSTLEPPVPLAAALTALIVTVTLPAVVPNSKLLLVDATNTEDSNCTTLVPAAEPMAIFPLGADHVPTVEITVIALVPLAIDATAMFCEDVIAATCDMSSWSAVAAPIATFCP